MTSVKTKIIVAMATGALLLNSIGGINPVKAADNLPKVSYKTHIQSIGWQDYKTDGELSGTEGKALRLEGIKIKVDGDENLGIKYSTHVQSIGWQDWKTNDDAAGTEGQAKRLEAIKIELTGSDAENYDIYYRVHSQNFGWLGWAKNGAEAGTEGYGYRLEGIEIKIVEKGAEAPGTTDNCFKVKPMSVSYRTHVQSIGWQSYVSDGKMAGTSGQSKRLEAINIKLTNQKLKGNIEYSTHVQNIGWQGFVKNNALSGTSGQSKRLEAIKIRLTDELAENYDIYYRVHAQNFGWLGWAKNGESAGTEGYGYRLEGIEIKLVEKGGNAPGSTSNAFKKKTNEPNKDTSNKGDKDNTGNKGDKDNTGSTTNPDTSEDTVKHDDYTYIKNGRIFFNGIPNNYNGMVYNKEYTYCPDLANQIAKSINKYRRSLGLSDAPIDTEMCVPIANVLANDGYQMGDDTNSSLGASIATTYDYLEHGGMWYGGDPDCRAMLGFRKYTDGTIEETGETDWDEVTESGTDGIVSARVLIPKEEFSIDNVLNSGEYTTDCVGSREGSVLLEFDQNYINSVGVSVLLGTDGNYWIDIVYYSKAYVHVRNGVWD